MEKLLEFGMSPMLDLGPLTLPLSHAHVKTISPREQLKVVLAGNTDVHQFLFLGKELAIVEAHGDGDIDLEIRDTGGRLVAADWELGDTPICVFTPTQTGVYTIRVINNESYAVDYSLEAN